MKLRVDCSIIIKLLLRIIKYVKLIQKSFSYMKIRKIKTKIKNLNIFFNIIIKSDFELLGIEIDISLNLFETYNEKI